MQLPDHTNVENYGDVMIMRPDNTILIIGFTMSSIACLPVGLQSLPRYRHRQADHPRWIHYTFSSDIDLMHSL